MAYFEKSWGSEGGMMVRQVELYDMRVEVIDIEKCISWLVVCSNVFNLTCTACPISSIATGYEMRGQLMVHVVSEVMWEGLRYGLGHRAGAWF